MSNAVQYSRQLKARLTEIENEQGIKFIHVADAGSRSWGSYKSDSDIDLKCIHVKLPWERSVEESTETLRLESAICALTQDSFSNVKIDLQSFELRKSLQLISRSDPVAYDMLFTPGVIARVPWMQSSIYPLIPIYQNKALMARRYAEMAYNNLWPERSSRDPKIRDNPPTKRALLLALRFTMLCEAVMQGKDHAVRDYQGLADMNLAAGYKRMWPAIMDFNDAEVHHYTAILRDFLDFLTRKQKEEPIEGERNRDLQPCQKIFRGLVMAVVLNFQHELMEWRTPDGNGWEPLDSTGFVN